MKYGIPAMFLKICCGCECLGTLSTTCTKKGDKKATRKYQRVVLKYYSSAGDKLLPLCRKCSRWQIWTHQCMRTTLNLPLSVVEYWFS